MSTPIVDDTTPGGRSAHAEATRDVLAALMNVKAWIRETHHLAYDGRTTASLLPLAVLERTGPSRVSELADRTRVDASVVSRQLSQLEQAGLVERERDPDDGRAHRLSLTDRGREVLEDGRERFAAVVAERLGDWEPGELSAFAATLRRLLADLCAHPTSL